MPPGASEPFSPWCELTKAIAVTREQMVTMLTDLRTKIVCFRALTTLQDSYRQDDKLMTEITDLKEEMSILGKFLQSPKTEDEERDQIAIQDMHGQSEQIAEENQTRHDEERDQIAPQDIHGEETEMRTRISSPSRKRARVLSSVRYGDGWRLVPPPPPPPLLTY